MKLEAVYAQYAKAAEASRGYAARGQGARGAEVGGQEADAGAWDPSSHEDVVTLSAQARSHLGSQGGQQAPKGVPVSGRASRLDETGKLPIDITITITPDDPPFYTRPFQIPGGDFTGRDASAWMGRQLKKFDNKLNAVERGIRGGKPESEALHDAFGGLSQKEAGDRLIDGLHYYRADHSRLADPELYAGLSDEEAQRLEDSFSRQQRLARQAFVAARQAPCPRPNGVSDPEAAREFQRRMLAEIVSKDSRSALRGFGLQYLNSTP